MSVDGCEGECVDWIDTASDDGDDKVDGTEVDGSDVEGSVFGVGNDERRVEGVDIVGEITGVVDGEFCRLRTVGVLARRSDVSNPAISVANGLSRLVCDCWRVDRLLVDACCSGCEGILKTFYEPSRWAPEDDTSAMVL
jgi:hypothetical protein